MTGLQVDDISGCMPKEPVKTPLSERLQEVLDDHGWSKSEWSERAGLSRGMVGQLMRGDLKGNSGVATFAALAASAGVHEEWLVSGRGPKKSDGVATSRRYPNLDTVLAYWRARGAVPWSQAAIDAVTSVANHSKTDLSVEDWETRLGAVHGVLMGKSPIPEGEDDGPKPPRKRK